jgi:hypothetical protein
MFHVKHFCPIDTLSKSISARRSVVRTKDFAQAYICGRVLIWTCIFEELVFLKKIEQQLEDSLLRAKVGCSILGARILRAAARWIESYLFRVYLGPLTV